MKKKVLISHFHLHEVRSGVPRKVLSEVELFLSFGYEVYVVAEKIDKSIFREKGAHPVKTFSLPLKNYLRRKFYIRQVERAVRKIKPDIVIGHGSIVQQDIVYIHNAVHLAHEKIHGKPLPDDHSVGRIHKQIFKERQFKLLVANSHLMKNDLMARFGIADKLIEVIYPEYDSTVFHMQDAEARREKKRSELEIPEDAFVFGMITSGNFNKRNINLFWESVLEIAKDTNEKIYVLIAGSGSAREVKKFSDDVPDNVVLLSAPSIKEVQDYYHAIDVFVLPAKIEEFGRSVLEAMACGKPVVVTDMVGATEIFGRGQKKYILKEQTVSSLAKILGNLYSSQKLRKQLSLENVKTAENYTKDKQNNKLVQVLKDRKFLE